MDALCIAYMFRLYHECILYRLSNLPPSADVDQSDLSDLELIQHINVDIHRLIKLLNGKTPNLGDKFE